jgi:signal transduction histidine kinase
MIHDLKTPLSVILGAIQLIEMKKAKSDGDDKCFSKNLAIIKYNCYRLLRLTNNLLELSKAEAGYLKLNAIYCNLTLLTEEIVNSVMPYSEQRKIDLLFKSSDDAVFACVDIEKFERIILNLLSNSIKFTEPGGTICVSVSSNNGFAEVTVDDTGSGIPKEMQENIFNKYKQSGCKPLIENEGSGIGLSLVKSYINLHNGNIRVSSEPGHGSRFQIDLPVSQESANACQYNYKEFFPRIKEAAKIEFSTFHNFAS